MEIKKSCTTAVSPLCYQLFVLRNICKLTISSIFFATSSLYSEFVLQGKFSPADISIRNVWLARPIRKSWSQDKQGCRNQCFHGFYNYIFHMYSLGICFKLKKVRSKEKFNVVLAFGLLMKSNNRLEYEGGNNLDNHYAPLLHFARSLPWKAGSTWVHLITDMSWLLYQKLKVFNIQSLNLWVMDQRVNSIKESLVMKKAKRKAKKRMTSIDFL